MTRLMYDSTAPWDIPRDAEMVAYYVDGRYAWPQAWLDMFPNAVKVPISAIGVKTAPVGDVEVGCIWPPANAVPWVRRARRDGYDPTIYVNELNDWPLVRKAFQDAGEPEPHYWTARYNGVRTIPSGAVGRQFAHPHDGDGVANFPWETGKHYDLSIVADFWPGIDAKAPGGGGGKPRNEGDEDMFFVGHWDHENDKWASAERYLVHGPYFTGGFTGEDVVAARADSNNGPIPLFGVNSDVLTDLRTKGDIPAQTRDALSAVAEKLDKLSLGGVDTDKLVEGLNEGLSKTLPGAFVAELKKEGN